MPRVVTLLEELAVVPFPARVNLETYVSPNFMGYFIPDKESHHFKRLTTAFTQQLAKLFSKIF